MAAELFSCTVTHPSDEQRIVRPNGEIDMLTAPDFRACLEEHLAAKPEHLILDFSGVPFFGSSGLAVLVGLKDAAQQQGTKLYIVEADRSVLRVLAMTGLAEMFSDEPPPP